MHFLTTTPYLQTNNLQNVCFSSPFLKKVLLLSFVRKPKRIFRNFQDIKAAFNFSDHVLASLIEDTFKVLASTPGCRGPLESRLIPTLVSILDAEGDKVTGGLQSVALDILQALVRASATAATAATANKEPPLSQLLVANAFPAAVKCTLHSDDNSVTQVTFLLQEPLC